MPDTEGKITIENAMSPGRTYRVDRTKYMAMREALMAACRPIRLVSRSPTPKRPFSGICPQRLFPGGAKAGWWLKAVQLDLEAKGAIGRTAQTGAGRSGSRIGAARVAAGHRADRTTLDAADGPRAPPRGKLG